MNKLTITSPRRRRFNLLKERFMGFWSNYKKNKKGLFGIGIIVFFILFAGFGPYLTENDPVNDWDVGGRRVPPAWFRYLPGNEHLVPNLHPIENVGFSSSDTINNWDIEPSVHDSIDIDFSQMGYEYGSGTGSLKITLNRDAGMTQNIDLKISEDFLWDYDSNPKRFSMNIALKLEGALGVILNIDLGLRDAEGVEHILWEKRLSADSDWFKPEYLVDSYSINVKMKYPDGVFADPASIIFNGTGEYEYFLKVSFNDIDHDSNVETILYVDDIDLTLKGTSYGLLGTDQWGRDVYSQLAHGARISLLVGLLSAIISVSIGLVVGLFAGFMGGMVDEVAMRFADMLLVIPLLPLLLILIAILGQSVWNIIMIISVLGWMNFSRLIRSQVLSLKERAFIEAARASGGSTIHIILRHILPNVMGLVFVSLATSVPGAITSESALAFLGLGDPQIMSWGQMLHDIVFYAAIKELYWVIPPGLCIALLAVSFVMMGFSLDEILNPRLRRR